MAMTKNELLLELQGLGKGLGAAGAKMSKSMGAPGLDVSPQNDASAPPKQREASQIAPEEQTPPEEIEGPETVEKLPPEDKLELDKLGMPDKEKLKGHVVKYDGRNYILDWDEEFQVYKLVNPDTMIVKTRVKPSMVSTLDFVVPESIETSINALLQGASLAETVDLLVEASWATRAKQLLKVLKAVGGFVMKHPGAVAAGTAGVAGAGYLMHRRKKAGTQTKPEKVAYTAITSIYNMVLEEFYIGKGGPLRWIGERYLIPDARQRIRKVLEIALPKKVSRRLIDSMEKDIRAHFEDDKNKRRIESGNHRPPSMEKMSKEIRRIFREELMRAGMIHEPGWTGRKSPTGRKDAAHWLGIGFDENHSILGLTNHINAFTDSSFLKRDTLNLLKLVGIASETVYDATKEKWYLSRKAAERTRTERRQQEERRQRDRDRREGGSHLMSTGRDKERKDRDNMRGRGVH